MSYQEDETIKLPPLSENGIVTVGDLWDCVSAKALGYNIYGGRITDQHVVAHPIRDFSYDLCFVKNTDDNIKTLFIDASVSLELMSGKIKIAGGVIYDNKDESKFNTATIKCCTRLESYVIQALSNAELDSNVEQLVKQGKINATHVCTQILVGAEATATLDIKETSCVDFTKIGGFLEGSIAVGPMTASASVTIKWLESIEKENINRTIKVNSKPPTINQPTNVEEMFAAINAMPGAIAKERHFPMIKPQVVEGVPLRFTLTPINFLVTSPQRKRYLKMDADTLKSFHDMMLVLIDFQGKGYLKNEVLLGDKRLVSILADSEAPLTIRVEKFEDEKKEIAESIHKTATDVFQKYKEELVGIEEIRKVVQEYNETFNPIQVYDCIERFIMDGKRELAGVHIADVSEEQKLILFTNRGELDEWLSQEKTMKVLLNTAGEAPGGAFLVLYGLSAELKALNIDVGVAYPSVSEDFSLVIKSGHLQVSYKKEEIVFALDIISTSIDKGKTVQSIFYTAIGSLNGISLPLSTNSMSDLNPLISTLREFKNVKICPSYLQLRELISNDDNTWKFVADITAQDSRADVLLFFRRAKTLLGNSFVKNIDWIVGSFGLDKYHDAPLLFVFRKGELRAICIDNLDLLILVECLKETIPNLDILSPEKMNIRCLYTARADFANQVIELLGQSHYNTRGNEIIESFERVAKTEVENAVMIMREAVEGTKIRFISQLANICLTEFPDILPILKKHGWDEMSCLFPPAMKELDWKPVIEEVENFFHLRRPFLAIVEYSTQQLQEILKTLAEPVEENDEESEEVREESRPGEEEIHYVLSHDECPDELRTKIGEYNYKDAADDLRLRGVIYVLQSYLDRILNEPGNFNLRTFILLAEKMSLVDDEEPTKVTIQDIIGKYGRRAAGNKIIQTKYQSASKLIIDSMQRRNYPQTLSILCRCQWDHKLYLVQETLYYLENLYDTDALIELIVEMDKNGFDDKQYTDLWKNVKFQFLMKPALQVSRILDAIKVYQCKNSIPDFLPGEFQYRIRQLMIQNNNFEFEWEQDWNDVNKAVQVFKAIAVRGYLPTENFSSILRDNVINNDEFKSLLQKSGALFFWNEKESYFNQPWDVYTVHKATEKIVAYLKLLDDEVVPVEIDVVHETEDFQDSTYGKNIDFIDKWQPVTNHTFMKLSATEFRKISDIIPQPSVMEYKTAVKEISGYLIQQLKMWNWNSLDPDVIPTYISYPKDTSSENIPGKIDLEEPAEELEYVPFVSRTDLQTCLIGTSDSIVSRQILSLMAQSGVPLPLIIPEVNKLENHKNNVDQSYRILLPLLKYLPIKYKSDESGVLTQHNLFSDSTRFICAVRLGSFPFGKSSILNHLMKSQQSMFSSRLSPGHLHGKPMSINGLVEFTWLNEETCEPNLWNVVYNKHYITGSKEAILLANLHGDALDHPEIMRELSKFVSCFLVFLMPDDWESIKDKARQLGTIVDKSDLYYIKIESLMVFNLMKGAGIETTEVDSKSEKTLSEPMKLNDENKKSPPGKTRINLPDILNHLLKVFETLIDHPAKPWDMEDLKVKSPVFWPTDIEVIETNKLLKVVNRLSCQTVRNTMELQKLNHERRTIKDFNSVWKDNRDLQNLVSLFSSVLTLPPKVRRAALAHLQNEIRLLSNNSILKLYSRRNQLYKELQDSFKTVQRLEHIVNVQNQVKEAKKNLGDYTLDLNHFFREIGRIYEATNPDMPLNYQLLTGYAQYITDGNEFEIHCPDAAGNIMWSRWLKETFLRSYLFTKYRVFIVSAVGMVASGKSTLLNSLFGCNFPVAVGGATMGMFLKFVFLKDELQHQLNYDAILVIDSEGLGLPGTQSDNETEVTIRRLASFITSISNLTLVNVMGDSLDELRNVLEIAFIKTVMTPENEIIPDMILIQHPSPESRFRGNIPSANTSQNDAGENNAVLSDFRSVLQEVSRVTEENELEIGVRVRTGRKLDTIMHRVKNNKILKRFHPFKTSEHLNNTSEYQKDVSDLYADILRLCKSTSEISKPINFFNWYGLSEKLWKESICNLEFPLGLKSVRDVELHLNNRGAILEVMETIDLAFKSHKEEFEEIIAPLVENTKPPTKTVDSSLQRAGQSREDVIKKLFDRLKETTGTCVILEDNAEIPCPFCRKALKLKEALLQRNISILDYEEVETYTQEIRNDIWNKMTQSLMAREMVAGKSEEFDKILADLDHAGCRGCWSVNCCLIHLKRLISAKTTVISPDRQIEKEAIYIYSNLVMLLNDLDNDILPDFQKLKAFDLDYYTAYSSVVDETDSCVQRSPYLDWTQQDWLQEKIKDIPEMILQTNETRLYTFGMLREMRKRVITLLNTFEDMYGLGDRLLPDFKITAHLYAIKIFRAHMMKEQALWDAENQPLAVLDEVLNMFYNN